MHADDLLDRDRAPRPAARGVHGAADPLRVTLADIVEAVASVTVDLIEQVAVVNHILRRGRVKERPR